MPKKNKTQISEETVTLHATDTKFALARKMISNIKNELSHLERILTSEADSIDLEELVRRSTSDEGEYVAPINDGKVVEGVFDGQNMVGSDGRQYMVPPNYASKSKLIEGDILKLTIQPNGTFLYKQIGPIERQRVVGELAKDEITGDWQVHGNGKKFNVLSAVISFHKADVGDEAIILIPKGAPSKWAAIENIIKRKT
jgi:hypothetical protein